MVKGKNKFLNIIILIIFILLLCFSLAGCELFPGKRDIIKEETGIEIPKAKTLYSFGDSGGLSADRTAFIVWFEFEQEPKDWLAENGFLSKDDQTIIDTSNGSTLASVDNKNSFLECFGFSEIKKDDFPSDYIPNIEDNDYFWAEIKLVFFYYFPEIQRLVVYMAASIPLGNKWN